MRCRPLDQRSASPTARTGEVLRHAETVRPLTLPSPSGRGFRVGLPRQPSEARGEPFSCKEKGRDEVSAPRPAKRRANRRTGKVSPHAQTVRPLTLPSPSGRGFCVGLPRPFPSWSGLSRPSTSSFVALYAQDVDARHKGEHDGEGEGRGEPLSCKERGRGEVTAPRPAKRRHSRAQRSGDPRISGRMRRG